MLDHKNQNDTREFTVTTLLILVRTYFESNTCFVKTTLKRLLRNAQMFRLTQSHEALVWHLVGRIPFGKRPFLIVQIYRLPASEETLAVQYFGWLIALRPHSSVYVKQGEFKILRSFSERIF